MARKTRHSGTSLVLIPVLLLQTACMTALGPPMPINPDDQAQRAAIERASHVRVVTVDGTPYRLIRVELAADQLSGLTSKTAGGRTVIPVDSISTVQAYKADEGMVFVGVIGVLVLAAVLASASALDCLTCAEMR